MIKYVVLEKVKEMKNNIKIIYANFRENIFPPFAQKSVEYFFATLKKDLYISKKYLEMEIAMKISVFARWMSHVGDGHLYTLMTVIFLMSGFKQIGLALAFSYLFGTLVFVFIKNKTKRSRPFHQDENIKPFKIPIDKYSFPSGHSTMAFLTASVIASFFPVWAGISYLIALLIGLARFALGVHYLTDIFCGAIIGYTIGKIICLFFT